MGRMAVTPCCGVVAEPRARVERARRRSMLRLGTCPLCGLNLVEPVAPEDDDKTMQAKTWFQVNAYKAGKAGGYWEWNDNECLLWRDLPPECRNEVIDLDCPAWVALEPYTGCIVVKVRDGDNLSVLAIKKGLGEYDNGVWKLPPVGQDVLIERLRGRGYKVYPSIEFTIQYVRRWLA